ncbi:nucleoside 2-deoxyribosyltransferase [Candidatus Bathyarchaeota archaeon]|nr:nucleoside 2-deoxyribosyltransferase [Candidatus Bathyarchaeota archaeon]MBS7612750.1 nucleoside 2-deoxyribosyltransferase [Candidatus Bathyarchaeota archaeon]MBS7617721.1 nucleoside 2-deoxyribosyltransferase [Candidatus Bathyarchaeota archaeon]
MKLRVFLAGPIHGFENRQEYRAILADMLEKAGCEVVNPWQREKLIYRGGVESSKLKTLVERDLKDIDGCDIFLAYIPILSAGVCMELFYAKRSEKKTVAICEIDNPSPWIIVHVDYMFKSIEEFKQSLEYVVRSGNANK